MWSPYDYRKKRDACRARPSLLSSESETEQDIHADSNTKKQDAPPRPKRRRTKRKREGSLFSCELHGKLAYHKHIGMYM